MGKVPKCKSCGEDGHYALSCFKKPVKAPVRRSTVKKVTTLTKIKPRAKTRSYYVKKLDSVFSQYVRLSESDPEGYGECITCGVRLFWKEAQACHFFTRGRYPTRWDEDNVHYGCYRCNVLLKGNYINYTREMLDRYSREFVDQLEFKSLNGEKTSTPELKEIIAYYSTEVERLKTEKSL